MDDKLLIIVRIKKSIQYIDKLLENYHKNEQTLRNNTKKELYALLKTAYAANLEVNEDRVKEQRRMLIELKMINFYLDTAYQKKMISDKQYINIGKHLLDIFVMTKAWIQSEMNEKSL